jgi:XTP/dITP diphosphohydrolase
MSLLVVPLAADEASDLTLGEWDRLRRCRLVMFEEPGHPLVERLRAEGVEAVPFDDEPRATDDGRALVAHPSSPRIVELAREGASVTTGVAEAPDGLTAAHGAYVGRRATKELGSLALVMARLRGPDGCPWDAEQTHESLETHLLEEANEVLQAIDDGHVGAELAEELGDVLLQVAFHSQLAADEGRFDLAEVGEGIVAKLVRRHPHVFGDVEVADAGEVLRNWQTIKSGEEKKASRPFDERALERALDRLLSLARRKGVDPDGAVERAVQRFHGSD